MTIERMNKIAAQFYVYERTDTPLSKEIRNSRSKRWGQYFNVDNERYEMDYTWHDFNEYYIVTRQPIDFSDENFIVEHDWEEIGQDDYVKAFMKWRGRYQGDSRLFMYQDPDFLELCNEIETIIYDEWSSY